MKMAIAALLLGAFVGLSAVVGGDRWYLIGFSYALLWPAMFAFAILPGVLVGSRLRSWQSCVVLTEIVTLVATTMLERPTIGKLLPWGTLLAMVHLALFPPVLLAGLIGYFGSKQREHGDQEPV